MKERAAAPKKHGGQFKMKLSTRNLILAVFLVILAVGLYVFTILEVVNSGRMH